MEYKVLVISANEVGYLEQRLNEMADMGYEAIHFFESNNRLVGLLRRAPISLIEPILTTPYQLTATNIPQVGEAPYGYKKDGTPKKAPGRKVPTGE